MQDDTRRARERGGVLLERGRRFTAPGGSVDFKVPAIVGSAAPEAVLFEGRQRHLNDPEPLFQKIVRREFGPPWSAVRVYVGLES